MDGVFERVCREFDATALPIAYSALEYAMQGGYGGSLELTVSKSGSSDTSAAVCAHAESSLRWGNGWSEWASEGSIEWETTSDHYVRFEFIAAQYEPPRLVSVVIDDDKSENFYPIIREICGDLIRVESRKN
jgi:hypothetical protein